MRVNVYVDEAGRGCLFGRIYAGSIAIPEGEDLIVKLMETHNKDKKKTERVVIRDSKKMSERQRNNAHDFLEKNVMFGVGWCSENEIDTIGINPCNIKAMHRAIDDLLSKYADLEIVKIWVDGILFSSYHDIDFEVVPHGDSKMIEIGAASIIAKTFRDNYISDICSENEILCEYGIESNKGYGTAKHIEILRKNGSHPMHRTTFIRNFQKTLKFL